MLVIDIHESPQIIQSLKQQVPETEVLSTSQQNWPDFYMSGPQGTFGLEHKAWSEILGNLAHIEEQLGRQHSTVDEHGIIIRGVVTPWDDGKSSMTWEQAGKLWLRPAGRGADHGNPIPYQQNYRGLMQKLASFQDWGIKVYQVASWQDTANLVTGLYHRWLNLSLIHI